MFSKVGFPLITFGAKGTLMALLLLNVLFGTLMHSEGSHRHYAATVLAVIDPMSFLKMRLQLVAFYKRGHAEGTLQLLVLVHRPDMSGQVLLSLEAGRALLADKHLRLFGVLFAEVSVQLGAGRKTDHALLAHYWPV